MVPGRGLRRWKRALAEGAGAGGPGVFGEGAQDDTS
jgi:hypothetical protein